MEAPSLLPSDVTEAPKNKGGRPKGSKTRPKWLREAVAPQRPRGRPKGSKNKPKSLEAFLTQAMTVELPPKPPPRPKNEKQKRDTLSRLSPEERSASARKAALARKKHQRKAREPGTPNDWTNRDYAPLREEARLEARRIYKIMEKQGLLPEDEIAKEALLQALQLMREPGNKDFKLKVIRTLLEHTHAKPSQKQDVTIRTAEDFLDELAGKDPGGSGS
jgi:hypothetical protein